jgi:hypothetical protein
MLNTIKEYDKKYFMNTFGERIPVCFEKGNGINLYSTDGEVYKDFFAGIAVNALGHSHPDYVLALKAQAEKLIHTSNLYYVSPQSNLAKKICEMSCADKVFFSNSGAEANECAIKAARKYAAEKKGEEYYSLLALAGDKTILNTATYIDVMQAVDALKSSEATKWYFATDNPFENVERHYQLKFKATLEGVDYRCMSDLLVVDHDKKIIYPVDLKTSSHTEWDFYQSFVDWHYHIQARLYWRIIRHIMDNDEVYKDYKLDDYRFIVVNKRTLTPLVWLFDATKSVGDLVYGKNHDIIFKEPFTIGKELSTYLSEERKVPMGIDLKGSNNLRIWLNTL